MTTATATFTDCYFGEVPMIVVPLKTTRRGTKVTLYRWSPAPSVQGCITGYGYTGYSSVERAVAVARAGRGFSNVEVA